MLCALRIPFGRAHRSTFPQPPPPETWWLFQTTTTWFEGSSLGSPVPSLIQIDSNKHVCCLVGLLCNDSKLRDCRWWWAACFRDFTRSWLPVFCKKKSVAVCHYQDDVEACKSVHVVGYANPNPTELFRLATLFITGHLVFFGSVPYLQHEEIFGIVSSYCNPLCWDMVGWKRFRANNTTKTNASTSQASWVLWKTSPTRLSPSLPVITK